MPPIQNMTAERVKNAYVDRIVNAIDHFLFNHESEHWLKQINALILRHDSIMEKIEGQRRWGFLYDAMAYRHPDSPLRGNQLRGLHLSLKEEMKALLADKHLVAADRASIRQALVGLVNPVAYKTPDLRNALPDCLVPAINMLKSIPRTGDVAFCLEPGSNAWIQFEKTKDKMEAYSATRLIY